MRISGLSNEHLVNSLTSLAGRERRLIVQVLLYLGEVEERRLHLDQAYKSMYDFCRRKLGYSEGESYRRIAGARLVRRFPQLSDMLATGAIHLTNLVLLVPVIHEQNFDELIAAIRGKTKKEVEHLVAGLAPKRDVPDAIRAIKGQTIMMVSAGTPATVAAPAATRTPGPADSPSSIGEIAPSPATTTIVVPSTSALDSPRATAPTSPLTRAPTPTATNAMRAMVACTPPSNPATATPLVDSAHPIIEQMLVALSAERFKVTFTASNELRLLIEKARDLMRHTNPKGDLATLFEHALKLLIAELEKRKFGKTSRPRKSKGPADPADVSRQTLRAVSTRDAEQCAFIADDGARCPARELLEVDHRQARALGGNGEAANLRLLCRPHNQREAEKTFGRAHVERKKRLRQERRSGTGATLELTLPSRAPGRPNNAASGANQERRE